MDENKKSIIIISSGNDTIPAHIFAEAIKRDVTCKCYIRSSIKHFR